jgi:type II secretory pathway pseudopilin PulG
LLELTLALLIAGLFGSMAATMLAARSSAACDASMPVHIRQIQEQLDAYAQRAGRYPRPASLGASPSESGYGDETATGSNAIATVSVGSTRVLIGALPHNLLSLATGLSSDCWGNKYRYAVTETYTIATHYADPNLQGAITLRRNSLASPDTISTTVGYVILSHGADALGANPAGHSGAARHCNAEQADASVARIDKENCDTTNAVFYATEYNSGDNAPLFFDDWIVYGGNPELPPGSCGADTVHWGTYCSAQISITIAGLGINLTNTANGYTGVALSTCHNGTRITLGTCLPIGACPATNPRTGDPMLLLTGIGMNFGTGVCKKYACCNGGVSVTDLSPCLLPVDLPGISIICP